MPPLDLRYLPHVYKSKRDLPPRTLPAEILLDYLVAALASGVQGAEAARRSIACYDAVEIAWRSLKAAEGEVEVAAKHIIRVLACEALATGAEGLTAAMRAKEAYRGIRAKLRQIQPPRGHRHEEE